MRKNITLRIAGITMCFNRVGEFPSFDPGFDQDTFITDIFEQPDTLIDTHFVPGEFPDLPKGRCLFDSGGIWRLFEGEGEYVIELRMPPEAERPYKALRIGRDFKEGQMLCGNLPGPLFPPITGYPLDEILMVNILSRGLGVEVHALGVEHEGRGYLFLGVSGSGKSTMARLWSGQNGVRILSDDRIIIRRINNTLRAFGTPWHGEAGVSDPGDTGISKIFFLTHAKENRATLLGPAEAASRMFVRCFPTFWDSEGMSFTLSFIENVVREIPCIELGFVPDESAVEFIKGLDK